MRVCVICEELGFRKLKGNRGKELFGNFLSFEMNRVRRGVCVFCEELGFRKVKCGRGKADELA